MPKIELWCKPIHENHVHVIVLGKDFNIIASGSFVVTTTRCEVPHKCL
jgi:hypothetical protein